MSAGIVRKQRKGQWIYECRPCGDQAEAVDQFRAIEYGQWHEKSFQHAFTGVGQIFAKAWEELSLAVTPTVEALSRVLEPPKNLPHDPSLRSDRRKWGGR